MKGVNIVNGEIRIGEGALGNFLADVVQLKNNAKNKGLDLLGPGHMRVEFFPDTSKALEVLLAVCRELGEAIGRTEYSHGDPVSELEILLPFTQGRQAFYQGETVALQGKDRFSLIRGAGIIRESVGYALGLDDDVTDKRTEKAFLNVFYLA